MRILSLLLFPGCIFVVSPGPGPGERTCDDIEEELFDELDAIQQCDEHADCGQPLANTSCGCTRDLVARTDADPADFQELLAEGLAEECENVGLDSVCDCPEAVGYRCDAGTCTWNYAHEYDFLPVCTSGTGVPFSLNGAQIKGDDLVLDVTYSGGCHYHDFALCWPAQAFMESKPVQASLEIFHDDLNDKCDGKVDEDVILSLRPLRDAFEDSYGSKTGSITVHVDEHSLTYDF